MVRDNALAVSGLLVEKIGGESVKPVQPRNAWKTVEGFMANVYRRDRDEKQYRRALYVYWKRGSPYPSMLNFDAVKRDSCTVTRATTTTPVQALTLLNDPVYVECAKMLGQRMLKDREAVRRTRDLKKPEEDAKRLAYGFRLCTSRLAERAGIADPREASGRAARTVQGGRRPRRRSSSAWVTRRSTKRSTPPRRRHGRASAARSSISTPRSTAIKDGGPPPRHQRSMNDASRLPRFRHERNFLRAPRPVTSTDLARRAFLGTSVLSLGSIALSSLMARRELGQRRRSAFTCAQGDDTPAYKLGSATATRVIMIFAAGGLSQHDLFDEKPLLNKRRGEELPDSVRKGQRITGVTEKQGALPVVGSCFEFKPYGKSGLRIVRAFPGDGCVRRRHLPGAFHADRPRAA